MSIPNAYDLKRFYNTFHGRVVRLIIRKHLLDMWSDCKGLTLFGYGYVLPYFRPYIEKAEKSYVLFPAQLGAHHWSAKDKNIVGVTVENALPLETNSVDRILITHALEFFDYPDEVFEELWRVLKSTGKIIIVVPNRLGFWSRADWTPFGQGRPYSAHQVENLLHENRFVHEQTRHALFSPAFKSPLTFRLAKAFEIVGSFICPALGGVHIIEASKQLYAGTRGTPVRAGGKLLEVGKKVVGAKKPVPMPCDTSK